MNWLQGSLVVYGLINITLGILAYTKSPVSLYAGGGAGILAFVAALIARSNAKVGYILGAIVCLALLVRFVPKLAQQFEVYPTLIIVASSAIMLLLLVMGHFLQKPS